MLSTRSPETRSFTIKPGSWDSPLEVVLSKHSLQSTKKFNAVSYAWKETAGFTDSPLEEIIVNGHTFKISSNLAAGLRVFRASYPSETIWWADAICHNQDDKAEMNIQLGHMETVYQRCDELHTWLGKEGQLSHPDSSLPANNGVTTKWNSTYRRVTFNVDGGQRERIETAAEDDLRVKQ